MLYYRMQVSQKLSSSVRAGHVFLPEQSDASALRDSGCRGFPQVKSQEFVSDLRLRAESETARRRRSESSACRRSRAARRFENCGIVPTVCCWPPAEQAAGTSCSARTTAADPGRLSSPCRGKTWDTLMLSHSHFQMLREGTKGLSLSLHVQFYENGLTWEISKREKRRSRPAAVSGCTSRKRRKQDKKSTDTEWTKFHININCVKDGGVSGTPTFT